ncbi:hypothetical protein AXF42_Ash015839 [Apostasia shenzhenica]|uniref:Uncharacterized protein n=1 Tax=Apostasia shenzhenica TaxID=1088818 RepID=A0A2H9ZXS3_9ASPA|nr:hypothetical protein AXF42_Ash015839 [Apostasia shenzhenica]
MAGKSENSQTLQFPARNLTVYQKSDPSKLKLERDGEDELLLILFGDSIVLEGSVDWSQLVQNNKYKLALTAKLTGYRDITIRIIAQPPFQQVLSKDINLSPSGELKVLNGPEFQVTGTGVMKYFVIVVGNVPPDSTLYVKGVDAIPIV